MTDVLNEIVNDPEMIIMTDEEDEDDVLNEMVTEREPVDPEDVFEKKHQVKESTGPTVEAIKGTSKKDKKEKPVKLTKSGRPRKQMSPEALARLEAGRKKALAARKQKAEAKRKEKEEQLKLRQLEIQAEQVKREKKKKQLKKVINGESSDEEEPKPKPTPAPAPQPQSVSVNAKIDDDVIQRAIQEALEKNEMMRQKRKAEKKAKQKEEVEKAKAQEKIKQAIYPPDRRYMGDQGFWSQNVFFTQ